MHGRYAKPDTVEIPLKSIQFVQNELMNDQRLTETGGWLIVGATLAVLLIPIAWIDDGPRAAWEGVQVVGGILGISAVLLSPYIILRRFNTTTKWTLVIKPKKSRQTFLHWC
jgi:hypothetical protein